MATRIINGSSTLYYIHNDHLGSNNGRMSTSAGSAVANSTARYTPFGDWRTEPTATLTDRDYTGHLHNNLGSGSDDLGLIYMNARYYLPSSGRFISPDTIVPDPANPQGFNRYSYSYNNPLKYVDPSGHISCTSANLYGQDQAACYDPTYNYPSYYESVGWMTVDPGAVAALETANLSESPHIADIIQTVKSGSEFWDSAFKNGAVMFLTLAGADVIADGAETIICAIKGQLGCAFTSGLATFIPGVSGGMVKEGLQSTANRLIPQYRFLVQRFDVKELRTMVNVYFGKDYMELSEGGTMEFVNELLLYVEKNGLQEHLRDSVIKFLEDHRYDPTVIEEFKNLFE